VSELKLLTVAEAAAALNLSVGTVRGLVAKRKIRHERHGLGRGVIRIPWDAVDEYRVSVTIGAVQARLPATAPARRTALRHLSRD
jgi:excisionase family DNA binding protein